MADSEFIGTAVERRRRVLDLSQSSFATLAGVSRGTIRNIEKGVVEPNSSTWEAIEAVLGWAPGSLERLEEQNEPIPVLPDVALTFLLDRIINEEDSPFYGPISKRLRSIVSSANRDGVLANNQLVELTDFVFAFEETEESTDRMITQIEHFQSSAREASVMEVGTLRTKKEHHRMKQDASNVEPTPVDKDPGLSDEVMELLDRGQVIDYDIFYPKDTENIAVVSLLVRKSNAPLGPKDRKYFSDVWGIMANLLHACDPESQDQATEKQTD